MDDRAQAFLRRLLDASGPSGYERVPARVWREEAATLAAEVYGDVLGNSYARLKHDGAPKVVIEGHIDEIGLLITHIDDQGYLWFDQIGGWDDAVVVGQRIRIASASGDVHGVIGRKAAHLIRKKNGDKATKTHDLWIDVGANDRADARALIEVGDVGVIDAGFLQLTSDLCVSRGMDRRPASSRSRTATERSFPPVRFTARALQQPETEAMAAD